MSEDSSAAQTPPPQTPPPQAPSPPTGRPQQNPVKYEEIEIVAVHADVVISKLESLTSMIGPESPLSKELEQHKKKRKILTTYLHEYEDALRNGAKYPKQPDDRKSGKVPWAVQLLRFCTEPYKLIRYATQWCRLAKRCLVEISNSSSDFDIRWNQVLTVRFCQLFTSFCRIVIFIQQNPLAHLVCTIVPAYIADIPKFKDFIVDSRLTLNFITQAIADPIRMINIHINDAGRKINRLAATIGAYLAQLLGPFPLIDWSVFSITRKQLELPETTLQEDDFFILQNISLLKDTMFYFVTIFPNTQNDNDAFSIVIENILSDAPLIPITTTILVPIDNFLRYLSENPSIAEITNMIPILAKRKFGTSHRKRIQNITILLSEIRDMCELNINLICQFYPNVLALCALGYYEFSHYFQFHTICVDALKLLSVLLDIFKVVKQNKEDIQRFYVYNLSTVDLQYLKAQLEQIPSDSPIPPLFQQFVNALEVLNIENLDNGDSYHYYSFKITYGRLLLYFNRLRSTSIVSYAETVFEHMTTIMNHIEYAEDPLRCLYKYCPIQTLWTYSKYFIPHINSPQIPTSLCITLLEIFGYFGQDPNVYIIPNEIAQQKIIFGQVQGQLLTRVLKELSIQCSNRSLFYQIGLQTRDLCKPGADPRREHFNINLFRPEEGNLLDSNYTRQFTRHNNDQKELRTCFTRMPQQIRVFDTIETPSAFFERGITDNFSQFLFPQGITPDSSTLDRAFSTAFQMLWQIFAQMGKPFPRNMFKARLIEGTLPNSEVFIHQVTQMKTLLLDAPMIPSNPRLVDKLQLLCFDFLKNGFGKTLYLASLKGFFNLFEVANSMPNTPNQSPSKSDDKNQENELQARLNYAASDYFSSRALRYQIRNLGISSAFAVDRIATSTISTSMISILREYLKLHATINEWHQKFRKTNELPPESLSMAGLDQCCVDMIRLGCAMQLRELVKSEMRYAINHAAAGFESMIDASFDRITVQLDEREQLICEACSQHDTMFFVGEIIDNAKLDKPSDFVPFMFFFGLLLNNVMWDSVKYYTEFDAISKNLHLFPVALNAFIKLQTKILVSIDDKIFENGMKEFYKVLRTIVNEKKSENDLDYAKSFTKLVILFPRVIDQIQFGWIDEIFPNYNADLTMRMSEQSPSKKKAKKQSSGQTRRQTVQPKKSK